MSVLSYRISTWQLIRIYVWYPLTIVCVSKPYTVLHYTCTMKLRQTTKDKNDVIIMLYYDK